MFRTPWMRVNGDEVQIFWWTISFRNLDFDYNMSSYFVRENVHIFDKHRVMASNQCFGVNDSIQLTCFLLDCFLPEWINERCKSNQSQYVKLWSKWLDYVDYIDLRQQEWVELNMPFDTLCLLRLFFVKHNQ